MRTAIFKVFIYKALYLLKLTNFFCINLSYTSCVSVGKLYLM